MMKLFISDAVVSQGYNGAPAVRFFNMEGGGEFAVFQIGKRKYDSRAENNTRWVNIKAKAFRDACERIKKMKLKEGSYVTIIGDYDEERWVDKDTKEKRSEPVIIIDDIEFSYGGGQKKEKNGDAGNGAQTGNGQGYAAPSAPQGQPYPNGAPAPQAQQQYGQYGTPPQQQYGMPPQQNPMPAQMQQSPAAPMPENFTGYEGFSAGNPFYPG